MIDTEYNVPGLTRLVVDVTRRSEINIMPAQDLWRVQCPGFGKVGCWYDEKKRIDHADS